MRWRLLLMMAADRWMTIIDPKLHLKLLQRCPRQWFISNQSKQSNGKLHLHLKKQTKKQQTRSFTFIFIFFTSSTVSSLSLSRKFIYVHPFWFNGVCQIWHWHPFFFFQRSKTDKLCITPSPFRHNLKLLRLYIAASMQLVQAATTVHLLH